MENSKIFWESSIEDIQNGYKYNNKDEEYICLICNKSHEVGNIYNFDDKLYDAKKAMMHHIKKEHGSMFDYLINLSKDITGVSDAQKNILISLSNEMSDKEIAKKFNISPSTVRSQRFKLKQKEKQAKVYMAIWKLTGCKEELNVHKSAKMVDERFDYDENDFNKVIKNYIDQNNRLKNLPSKEKKKIIILRYITNSLEREIKYSEKQLNELLKSYHDDYATLRRYLIEYGFLERTKDCNIYWVKP